MPKMKTKSSAKKRFRVRGSGSVKRAMAFKRHILTKRTTKNKRQLRGTTGIHSTNADSVKAMRGEVLASRALALATLGRLSEAIEMASTAAALAGTSLKTVPVAAGGL